jgi:hypothetical protein
MAIFIHFLCKVPRFPFSALPSTLMHLILSPFQQIDDCQYLVFWPSLLLFALDVKHQNIKGKKLESSDQRKGDGREILSSERGST